MKKISKVLVVLLLVVSVVCLLFACTDTPDNQNDQNNQNNTNNSTDVGGDNTNTGNSNGGDNNETPIPKPPLTGNNVFVFEPTEDGEGCVLSSARIVNPIVDIPALSNNLPVVSIAQQVFYSSDVVKEVNLPDTIVEIGERAFSLCVNLEKVNITESSQLKKIGDRAFFECERLNTIYLPQELVEVGDEAFSGCIDLVSLTFPASLHKVGAFAFHNGWFNALTDLGVVYVGNVAYSYLYSSEDLTPKAVVLKESTTAIAGKAFYGIDYISSISIPASTSYIGAFALNNSGALQTISVDNQNEVYSSEGNTLIEKASVTLLATTPSSDIPAYVEIIGEEAYAYLNVTSITLPDSVRTIMQGAFKGSLIESIDLPSEITTIEDDTFLSCEALKSITIPQEVTKIKNSAFNYCTALTSVTIESDTILELLDTPFACSGLIARAEVVYVKEGLVGQADQLIAGYQKATSDKAGYFKYVKEN